MYKAICLKCVVTIVARVSLEHNRRVLSGNLRSRIVSTALIAVTNIERHRDGGGSIIKHYGHYIKGFDYQ